MAPLKFALPWITFMILALFSEAFSPTTHKDSTTTARTTSRAASALMATTTHSVDRKTFLQTSVWGALLVATPSVARADVTSKVASSAALRNVKLVQKKLAGLEVVVQADEYAELKESLRVAPFSDLRKSMSTLVKGGEDGPDAAALQEKYKNFIARLEKMDSTASLALRGKKLSEGEFTSTYRATVDALADFLETAQAAVEIPLQYSDS